MIRSIMIACALLAIVGCKVTVKVPEGGRVIATSGAMDCGSGRTCEMDIADTHFKQTFRAIPNEGWEFIGWQDNILCDNGKADCTITTVGLDYDNPATRDFLSNQNISYDLAPRFRRKSTQPQYPNVAGRYFQKVDSYWLNCAYPLGALWGDADFSYVRVSQNGKNVTIVSERAPDPNIKYTKEWDGKLMIDSSGKFFDKAEIRYVMKTVEGKIKVTESLQVGGQFANGSYLATQTVQANLVPQFGPYKGKSIRCTTDAVRITGERT